MPSYEFSCAACGQQFEVRATIREREAGLALRCPHCGSTRTEQVLSVPMLVRRDPGAGPASGGCCGRGAGCCGS